MVKQKNWKQGTYPLVQKILSKILGGGYDRKNLNGFLNHKVRKTFDEITYALIKNIYLSNSTVLKFAELSLQSLALEHEISQTTSIINILQHRLKKYLIDRDDDDSDKTGKYHNQVSDTIHRLSKSRASTEQTLKGVQERMDLLFLTPNDLLNSTFDLTSCFLSTHDAVKIVADIREKVYNDTEGKMDAHELSLILENIAEFEHKDFYRKHNSNGDLFYVKEEKDERWVQKMSVLLMNLLMCYKDIGLTVPHLNDPLQNKYFLDVLNNFGFKEEVIKKLKYYKLKGDIQSYIQKSSELAAGLSNLCQLAQETIESYENYQEAQTRINLVKSEIEEEILADPTDNDDRIMSKLKREFLTNLSNNYTIYDLWEDKQKNPDETKFTQAD